MKTELRKFNTSKVSWIVALASALVNLIHLCWGQLLPLWNGFKENYHVLIPYSTRHFLWVMRHEYWSFAPLLVIFSAFVLEKLMPAKPRTRIISISVIQDFFWFVVDVAAHSTVIFTFGILIKWFYDHYLSFFTLHIADQWPQSQRILFAFLLFDFTQWANHYLRHKVRPFWFFHAVHHSQTEMNLFTSERIHPLEYVIRKPTTFIPLYIFQVHPFGIVSLTFFIHWYTRFYHANIRSNFGFLKHFMVTPQFHRIHHSREAQHQDKNLGAFLTIWDRMFGTLHTNYEEYPETGIHDSRFPMEKQGGLFIITNYAKQFIYPMKQLAKEVFQR